MKIRNAIELNNALDKALAWRKKEITTFLFTIKSNQREHIKQAFLRASIPILYSHWEGYAKEASNYYMEFVARQHLPYCDLTTNFISISCWKSIKEISKSNQFHTHNKFIDFLTYNQNKQAEIPYKNAIDTESNLSSKVLQNILIIMGIPFDRFWQGKALAIDGKLLHYRNKIAHGVKHMITESTFIELHDLVIELLNYMKNSIENSAIQQKYKRNI